MYKFFLNCRFGKSEKEIQQEMETLGKLIFPLGDMHRDKIKALLYGIDNKKLDQADLMISFVEGKQRYLKDQDISAIYPIIKKSRARFSTEQIKNILSLIILDSKCENIDQLPELEQIQNYAKSIELPAI